MQVELLFCCGESGFAITVSSVGIHFASRNLDGNVVYGVCSMVQSGNVCLALGTSLHRLMQGQNASYGR